jgi:hypothetical protein
VPLVEAGDESSAQNRDGRPTRRPLHIAHRGQGGAPRAEKQNAQRAIADDMSCLANEEVPVFKVLPVQAEEEMQHGIENAASVMGRKQCAGFDGNDDQPENGGDPRLENFMSIGAQEAGLLDAIVGGLAGNHYVVDMALPESGAADADEARFLQKFGDGSAATVAHA